MSLGDRIKSARKSKGLSMRNLAEKAGLSAMAISKYERDEIKPASNSLMELAKALDVGVEYFFRNDLMSVELQVFRKRASLGAKKIQEIKARVTDWLERYLTVESFLPEEQKTFDFTYSVSELSEIEIAAKELRRHWNLGLDPIEHMVDTLEENGIKIGVIEGFREFDACVFQSGPIQVIAIKKGTSGDRQRFNIAHELGHIFLQFIEEIEIEKAANRFAGAFLAPDEAVFEELGRSRKNLDLNELHILKHKYGMSMQAWIYRAKDLGIISQAIFVKLFKMFSKLGFRDIEPGAQIPEESPKRMQQLLYRLLSESIISRSRAEELYGGPISNLIKGDKLLNASASSIGG